MWWTKKEIENGDVGVGRLSFAGANKSVAAEVRKVENELELLYDDTAKHQLLTIKRGRKKSMENQH